MKMTFIFEFCSYRSLNWVLWLLTVRLHFKHKVECCSLQSLSIVCMKAHSVVYNNHSNVYCIVIIWWLLTKHCGPVGSTVLSYLGGSGFSDQSGDHVPWLGFFEVTAKVVRQIGPWPFSIVSISIYGLVICVDTE